MPANQPSALYVRSCKCNAMADPFAERGVMRSVNHMLPYVHECSEYGNFLHTCDHKGGLPQSLNVLARTLLTTDFTYPIIEFGLDSKLPWWIVSVCLTLQTRTTH